MHGTSMSGIYKDPKIGNRILMFGVAMFLLFIGSAFAIALGHVCYRNFSIALGAVWVVGVPTFFFFEDVLLFRKYGDPSQYERFKRTQDLAAKIWAGAILVLAAFFADTFPK